MRTPRELYPEKTLICKCELEYCPVCKGRMTVAYSSGPKIVQTMQGVYALTHFPKHCINPNCRKYGEKWKSAKWQRTAPLSCTYGYDVIARVGWLRQTGKEPFAVIQAALATRLKICETRVRNLYHERYLPLLACHERQSWDQLRVVADQSGLVLSLDGLAPEGGEPQLWVVRELHSGLTLRSGWLARQDEDTFVNFLQPIADLSLPVKAIMSDKQRGLVPAVADVFPQAKHSFCQIHYLQNAAAPIAEADEGMKVTLRKGVREEIGSLIRREKVENDGVLTTTGLIPSPEPQDALAPGTPQAKEQVCETIRQDLRRRIRYLLTLKGRPPFRLAGLEMFERLTEVKDCLERLLAKHPDPCLEQLHQGLCKSLQSVQVDYQDLRQAANWLGKISDLLDPEGKPTRSGGQVKQTVLNYLNTMQFQSRGDQRMHSFCQVIKKTTRNYEPGLFHCYDIPALPRTNNDRESEFRDLNRRLLATTGQKGLVRRILQREGAWEVIPRPRSIQKPHRTC